MANSDIGYVVSVTTREEFRIEVTLSYVDLKASLIILSNAKCYGTEGRERNLRSQVLPCHELHGNVHIREIEIKDMELIYHLPHMVTEVETEFPPISRPHVHRA